MPAPLTYRQAAKTTRRSIITVKHWRRNGMPMGFDSHGRRVVDEGTLFAWLRERLQADPADQY